MGNEKEETRRKSTTFFCDEAGVPHAISEGTMVYGTIIDNKDFVGEIHIEDKLVYVLQNKVDGADAKDKKGYKFSYYVGSVGEKLTDEIKGFFTPLVDNEVEKLKPVAFFVQEVEEYFFNTKKKIRFPLYEGTKVSGFLPENLGGCDDKQPYEGEIHLEDGRVFILQNVGNGTKAKDTKQYRYSWWAANQGEELDLGGKKDAAICEVLNNFPLKNNLTATEADALTRAPKYRTPWIKMNRPYIDDMVDALGYSLKGIEKNSKQPSKKSFMTNITNLFRRLTLSSDDKLMQELGLETENGTMTCEGYDFLKEFLYQQNRAALVEKAKEIKAQMDAEKNK